MEPAELEAKGVDTVDVKFKGEVFTLPATLDQASPEVLESIENQKFANAMRLLLGDDGWDRFKAIPGVTIADMGQLLTDYSNDTGQVPGE